MASYQQVYNRVLAINNDLRALGYEWNYIEGFWKYCTAQAKLKDETNNTKKLKSWRG
jgi:hypothetical protein